MSKDKETRKPLNESGCSCASTQPKQEVYMLLKTIYSHSVYLSTDTYDLLSEAYHFSNRPKEIRQAGRVGRWRGTRLSKRGRRRVGLHRNFPSCPKSIGNSYRERHFGSQNEGHIYENQLVESKTRTYHGRVGSGRTAGRRGGAGQDWMPTDQNAQETSVPRTPQGIDATSPECFSRSTNKRNPT